ncbi:MAG: heavy metal translocating P-type ATPase [Thermodesulfovibrionales bacterium]|nr:heavy metal translocating P-type ATPase [Thermodesulfovibrionales bacterium]
MSTVHPTYFSISLIHELPDRIRFRMLILRDRSCDVAYIEAYIEAIDGVKEVRINREASSIAVSYDGRPEVKERVIERLSFFSMAIPGYKLISPEEREKKGTFNIIKAGIVLLVSPMLPRRIRAMVTLVSISPLLFRGFRTLITEGIKIDVLSATAVSLSFLRRNYFAANVTYLLTEIGEYIEHTTQRQSDRLIRSLLRPDMGMAWVERDRIEIQIPSGDIKVGDIVISGAGNIIPVDGEIIDGVALVNQASITGESIPLKKEIGDYVLSGTVIEEGRIKISADFVGDETTTARITRFVEHSLMRKSKTERRADEMGNRSVYITLGLAAIVFALTGDLNRVASVLFVDYACSTKLAPSVAFKSTMHKAASSGILVKGGEAIENLAKADIFIFDKTGTITLGIPELTDCIALKEGWESATLLALAASMEEHYLHPIGEAIVRSARKMFLPFPEHSEVDLILAHGLSTHINGRRVLLGSRHFMEEHENISFSEYDDIIQRLDEQGKTVLFMAIDKEPLGMIALRDQLREECAVALKRLKDYGVRSVVMVSGDSRERTMAIASGLPVDEVYYELMPEDKSDIVRKFRNKGKKVAFVGDGINDAPAIISADVGICMTRGADIARETADVVLNVDSLNAVADATEFAQKTMRLINTNFNISVGVNTAVFLAASSGILSPVASAVLHNGTTVVILLNAMGGISL